MTILHSNGSNIALNKTRMAHKAGKRSKDQQFWVVSLLFTLSQAHCEGQNDRLHSPGHLPWVKRSSRAAMNFCTGMWT